MPNSARVVVDVGTVIADTYKVEALIGAGGMGSVFLASHARLPGKQVAIKLLHAGLEEGDALGRFKREAEIASLSPERVIPSPEAPAPPAPPRRPRAVGSIRCHLHGEPITLSDGQDIPEGVDLSTLPKHAFEEG